MANIYEKKDRLSFLALMGYFFTVAYGSLFTFGSHETSMGLSTILILTIIVAKLKGIPTALLRQPLFITILFLLFWCIFSSLLSKQGILNAYTRLAVLFGYLFAAAAAYRMAISEKRIRLLLFSLCISILVASLLTIVDFLKIYNIPFVNEVDKSSLVGGERVAHAGGFFPRRTAMAAYYSLIIPTLLYYAIKTRSLQIKLMMFMSGGVSSIALFLTHSRSGILSTLIALLAFMVFDRSLNLKRKISVMVYTPIVLGIIIFIAYAYFPEHFEVYVVKLGIYLPGNNGVEANDRFVQADSSRIYFFKTAMASLLSNPIGNGFSLLYTEDYGLKSPHNIITYVIWAAGVVAFIWLPLFVYQITKTFSLKSISSANANDGYILAVSSLQVGLLSWVLNNMAHNSLNTGLAWLFMGIVLNVKNKLLVDKNSYKMRHGQD